MSLSQDCIDTQGLQFIAQECEAKKFLDRLNKIEFTFCEIERRIEVANSKITRDCQNIPSSSSEEIPSSSSSSSICQLRCQSESVQKTVYLLKNSTLDEQAYAALDLLEDEVCETLRQLVELELLANTGCPAAPSSSESSSSSVPPSSSSSVPPSSSSSSVPPSSSSSSFGDCIASGMIMLGLYCPSAPDVDIELEAAEVPNPILYGECYWKTADAPPDPPEPDLYASIAEPVSYSDGLGLNDALTSTPTPLYGTGVFAFGEEIYSSTGEYSANPYSEPAPFIQVQRVSSKMYMVVVGSMGYSEFENTDTSFPITTDWTAVNLEGFTISPYVGTTPTPGSSSSMSSSFPSSAPASRFSEIRYNLSLNRWEWNSDYGVIAYRYTPDYSNPTGTYTYVSGACASYNIFLVNVA